MGPHLDIHTPAPIEQRVLHSQLSSRMSRPHVMRRMQTRDLYGVLTCGDKLSRIGRITSIGCEATHIDLHTARIRASAVLGGSKPDITQSWSMTDASIPAGLGSGNAQHEERVLDRRHADPRGSASQRQLSAWQQRTVAFVKALFRRESDTCMQLHYLAHDSAKVQPCMSYCTLYIPHRNLHAGHVKLFTRALERPRRDPNTIRTVARSVMAVALAVSIKLLAK